MWHQSTQNTFGRTARVLQLSSCLDQRDEALSEHQATRWKDWRRNESYTRTIRFSLQFSAWQATDILLVLAQKLEHSWWSLSDAQWVACSILGQGRVSWTRYEQSWIYALYRLAQLRIACLLDTWSRSEKALTGKDPLTLRSQRAARKVCGRSKNWVWYDFAKSFAIHMIV